MDVDTEPLPALIHYTEGGPWFEEYRRCPYAKEWFAELEDMAPKGAFPFLEA